MEQMETGWLLDGDYPDEGQLNRLHERGKAATDSRAQREFLNNARALLHPVYGTFLQAEDRNGGLSVYLATGGWSGNEQVLECMQGGVGWLVTFRACMAGGGYIFRVGA